MAYVNWDKSLSTGIDEIDEQHKEFIGYINQLEELVDKKYDKDKAVKIVKDLYDYAKHHFNTCLGQHIHIRPVHARC